MAGGWSRECLRGAASLVFFKGAGFEFFGESPAGFALEVFEGEAELGQQLLVRNALATVEGVASSSDLTGFVQRHRFIVQGSVGEAAGNGIEDSFEQADDGGKLCRGKPVNQFVGVLFGVGHESSSPLILT